MILRTYSAAVMGAMLAFISPAVVAAEATHESVSVQFQHALPNAAGKKLVSVIVDYPAGARSAAHRHAKSAFIYVYVLAGSIRSQVDDEPAKVYRAGESWFEMPGAHHKVSENASSAEPAKLLALFVVESGEALTIPDPH
ncbi:MAG: cupin domain-containing protein [Gammaproteobacteria bacterium]|nr:MAG: cupin domain-containing protein [Gammaproteobacteria bacterium]